MIDETAFRHLALSLCKAIEKPHFEKSSFLIDAKGGKIFATLEKQARYANVKLSCEEQDLLIETEPQICAKVPNAWGDKGWTALNLAAADRDTIIAILAMAWRHAAPKHLHHD